MDADIGIDMNAVARRLKLTRRQVQSTVELLDAGNTVPFLTRYRKDQTGGLDEEQIRAIQTEVARLRQLALRRQSVLSSIKAQGKLTDELAAEIEKTTNARRLEDLYLPYRPKKQTLATAARDRGLGPLAEEIEQGTVSHEGLEARAADFVDPDKEVATVADALLGAGHILAEGYSDRADVRDALRKIFRKSGQLRSTKGEADEKKSKVYADFFDFKEPLTKIKPHRILALNRGERENVLRVKIETDTEAMHTAAEELVIDTEHVHAELLRGCLRDALVRLVFPSLEREFRRELTEKSENHAVDVFAQNLRNLLLQPPVSGKRTLAVDPGFKSGCKLAAIDAFGELLDHAIVHIVGKKERIAAARVKLAEMIRQHELEVIAIGNGTACRETEQLISDLLAEELKEEAAAGKIAYVIVNEAGASVYSTSQIGREEFPELDATLRGAISIGRRLLDPLSELVKIDPASIGVGLYQHDVKGKNLSAALDQVVQSCVNYVGVDLNTASSALLRYVSGLNQLTSRRLFEYRQQNGPFTSREQLKSVPGFGEATFVQAAGFLKIAGGENTLDTTWIHPESYEIASKALEQLDSSLAELQPDSNGDEVEAAERAPLAERIAAADHTELSEKLGIGTLLLKDILSQLGRPGRDPREDLPAPIFKQNVLKLEDLEEGLELTGSVLNVVDFGVFVDIGLHESSLVHVSQIANRYIRDPHEVVSVGDVVKVWVTGIDRTRRRVSLTMVEPGTETPPPAKGGRKGRRDGKPSDGKAQGGGKPRGDKKPRRDKRSRPQGGAKRSKPPSRPHKPKPVVPITNEMLKGDEPMRTFGDLKQFVDKSDDKKSS